MDGLSGALSIANGFNGGAMCAVLKDGGATCWGWSRDGQLGAGSAVVSVGSSPKAVEVVGWDTDSLRANWRGSGPGAKVVSAEASSPGSSQIDRTTHKNS